MTDKMRDTKEMIKAFEDKIDDPNLISDLFDHMQFDCSIRVFANCEELDESIRAFCKSKSTDDLARVVDLIRKSKESACIEEQAFLVSIKQYIEDHLTESMTVEELASQVHFSYYYLCHLFKKLTGKSIQQYRTEKRLEKAIPMLLQTDKKISEIAPACGFDNFSYFTEVFVEHVGMSPSEFRKTKKGCVLHSFYEFKDMLLAAKLEPMRFLDTDRCEDEQGMPYVHVHDPGAWHLFARGGYCGV